MTEFDERRFGLITGSKCSVLFPKKSAEVGQRTYAKQLANQLYFKYYDDIETWQMGHGKDFEAEAYIYYKDRYDNSAIHKPEFALIGDCGGSADCIGDNEGADFKCPTSLQNWLEYLHEGIDDQQYHQAQMYMHLYKKEHWNVCAYLAEPIKLSDIGISYPVKSNQRMIIRRIDKEPGWDKKLDLATPKIIEMRDQFLAVLTAHFKP